MYHDSLVELKKDLERIRAHLSYGSNPSVIVNFIKEYAKDYADFQVGVHREADIRELKQLGYMSAAHYLEDKVV